MNKKLLAITISAIAAATALPVVAEAAGPTLYGKINLSLESVTDAVDKRRDSDLDNNPVAPPTGADSDEGWVLRSNDSRLGVKGEAETGITGLTGVYQMEFSVATDGENGPFGNRDIFAGLKGSFGLLRLGNMDTPLKKAQGKVDLFNDSAADIKYHIAGEKRMANSISYSSPKIADALTINLAIAPGEGLNDPDPAAPAADTLDGPADFLSASVTWEASDLYLALAMDKGVANGSSYGAELASGDYLDITRLVAGYKLDALSLGLMYQLAEESFDVGGNADEDKSLLLSVGYKLGDATLKAQFSTTEGDDGNDTAGDKDREVTQLALGADYALGKSTTVFAFYSTLEDDEGTASDDDNYDVLAVGIDQKF